MQLRKGFWGGLRAEGLISGGGGYNWDFTVYSHTTNIH